MKLKLGNEQVNISCTWGDGPDVLFDLHRSEKHMETWKGNLVPLDLTAEEAIHMGKHLISCGKQALALEQVAKDHDDEE